MKKESLAKLSVQQHFGIIIYICKQESLSIYMYKYILSNRLWSIICALIFFPKTYRLLTIAKHLLENKGDVTLLIRLVTLNFCHVHDSGVNLSHSMHQIYFHYKFSRNDYRNIFIVGAESPPLPVNRYKSIYKFCQVGYYKLYDTDFFQTISRSLNRSYPG